MMGGVGTARAMIRLEPQRTAETAIATASAIIPADYRYAGLCSSWSRASAQVLSQLELRLVVANYSAIHQYSYLPSG